VAEPVPVLHTIDTGGPGGAETVFAMCVTGLFRGRQNPMAAVPYDGWLANHLRGLNVQPDFLHSRGAMNLRYLAGLARLARRHGARLIHSHLLGSNVYSAIVGRLLGIPVIAVFHGATDLRDTGRLNSIKRWWLRQAHVHVVAVSQGVRAELERWGLPPDCIQTIYNGVDASKYSPGRATDLRGELGIPPDTLLVGAVGNIRAPKAYDLLLRTAKIVAATRNVHFAVIGEGSQGMLDPLLRLRTALGLEETVTFLGFRPASPDLLRNFDVFISSARSEGLPLSFLEAMAIGLPVVATPTSGALEVLESGKCGLIAEGFDEAALARVLCTAVDDAGLRASLGAAGRSVVLMRFSTEAMTAAYDKLYDTLLRPS
jgi:glycosyltransferase involved in cell wall biosynthesis